VDAADPTSLLPNGVCAILLRMPVLAVMPEVN
jgi:hypothetical protein